MSHHYAIDIPETDTTLNMNCNFKNLETSKTQMQRGKEDTEYPKPVE